MESMTIRIDRAIDAIIEDFMAYPSFAELWCGTPADVREALRSDMKEYILRGIAGEL